METCKNLAITTEKLLRESRENSSILSKNEIANAKWY